MKTIYVEKCVGEETQHVYVDIDGRSHLEVQYCRGSIVGIMVQNLPLSVRLKDHKSSDLKTGDVSGISDEMFGRLVSAASVVHEFRKILVPIVLQPEKFLKEARLQIASSI